MNAPNSQRLEILQGYQSDRMTAADHNVQTARHQTFSDVVFLFSQDTDLRTTKHQFSVLIIEVSKKKIEL